MQVLKSANLALSFLLELAALAALAAWGWHVTTAQPGRLLLAVGAPLLGAVIWGSLLAPRAPVTLPVAAVRSLQLLFFAVAAAALYRSDRRTLALALVIAVVLNFALIAVWNQWDGSANLRQITATSGEARRQ